MQYSIKEPAKDLAGSGDETMNNQMMEMLEEQRQLRDKVEHYEEELKQLKKKAINDQLEKQELQ